ncbi:MAG: hemerythrin domain-containing protein [Dermatophilaceae bacterium]
MATATMSMNQVIHAAVRRDFARLEDALGRPEATGPERARALGRAFEHLAAELHRHHTSEETIVLPLLRSLAVPEEICGHVISEHADMVRALTAAEAAVTDYVRSPDEDTRTAALAAVRTAAQVTATHLDHEEAELEPVMATLYDTRGWTAAEKELRKAPPRVTGDFVGWVSDGASPAVQDAIDAHIPRPVQVVYGRFLGHRYRSRVAPVWR